MGDSDSPDKGTGKIIGFIKKVDKALDEVDSKVDESPKDEVDSKVDEPYGAMWVIPIFLGLLGGILAYIALKDHDQRRANDMMSYGIMSSVVSIALIIFIWVFSIRGMMDFMPY